MDSINNIDWIEQWELFKAIISHIDLVIFAKYLFIGILLSALISITAMFFLRKYILVKRRHFLLTGLAYFWIISIPLFSVYTGVKYGLVHAIHKNVEKEVTAELSHLSASMAELVGEEWASALVDGNYECKMCEDNKMLELSPDNAIDVSVAIVYDLYYGYLSELDNNESNFIQGIGTFLHKTIEIKVISWGIKKGITKLLEDKVGIDGEITDEIMDTKFKDIFKDGLFAKIINMQLSKIFGSIKTSTLMIYFLVLLIPLTEIIIANYLFNQSLKDEGEN